jgi:hypothetical protein
MINQTWETIDYDLNPFGLTDGLWKGTMAVSFTLIYEIVVCEDDDLTKSFNLLISDSVKYKSFDFTIEFRVTEGVMKKITFTPYHDSQCRIPVPHHDSVILYDITNMVCDECSDILWERAELINGSRSSRLSPTFISGIRRYPLEVVNEERTVKKPILFDFGIQDFTCRNYRLKNS